MTVNLHIYMLFQMEFYFSDANLQKDRFIKKLLTASPDGCQYINY